MFKIPYYDSADRTLLNFLTPVECERYVTDGTAWAVRAKSGQVSRLYRKALARVYGSAAQAVAGMHASASGTTERLRDSSGVIFAPPETREHKRSETARPTIRYTPTEAPGVFTEDTSGLTARERLENTR
jgi:hypothetical protein